MVKENNILLTMPQDLDILFTKFKDFVNVVSGLFKENSVIPEKIRTTSGSGSKKQFSAFVSLPALPYDLLEIINRVYTFYFIVIMPREIKNEDVITKLLTSYFAFVLKMYSYVTKEIANYTPRTHLSDSLISQTPIYASFLDSDKTTSFSKIINVAEKCEILKIQNHLFDVLDFVWSKNISFINLVYGEGFPHPLRCKQYLKETSKSYADYDYEHDVLKQMHITIDHSLYIRRAQEDKSNSHLSL